MTYDSDIPSTSASSSVSAMFDSRHEAQRAVDRLQDAGISSTQIRMVEGSEAGAAGRSAEQDKGFWDSLGDFFFPDEDRYTYAEGLSRGSCLVTVTGLAASDYDLALDILDDEGTIDLNEREQSWRSEGWGGYEGSPYASGTGSGSAAAAGMTGAALGVDPSDSRGRDDRDLASAEGSYAEAGFAEGQARWNEDESIPVVEERLRVGKRDTSHGRVRVRAYTVEEPVSETVELRDERVELERRPVDRPVSSADAFQDRTIEAEEYSEEAVVSKEARVVEEIGLRKVSDSHQETVSDTVKHTEVEIEDDRTDGSTTRR